MRFIIIAAFLLTPITAFAKSSDTPFSDMRLSAGVMLGAGANSSSGGGISANAHIAGYIPLFANLGIRPGATFFTQTDMKPQAEGAILIGVGAALDYTLRLGEKWGLGIAGGAEFVPFGSIQLPGAHEGVTGVDGFGEIALRRVIRPGLWEFGLRGDQFISPELTVTNFGAYFRFSFRL